jgi:O-antigen ligase
VVFSAQFALYRILDRFAMDPLADARVAFARTTIAAAKAYMPLGSGIGTFVPVYALFEQPKDALIGAFVNHAHDDFLEVWLESGIFGIGLMGAFVVWFVPRTVRVWRRPPSDAREIDHSLARSATMIVALLIAHSLVDYPLRTGAMTAIFAFCCALLIEPISGAASKCSSEEENSRHNMMRRNAHRNERIATMSAGRRKRIASGLGERWGDDIDWPDEWRNRTQT